jgi:hypothetical protein
VTKEQLIHDFKVVVADAEALLKATAQGGEAMTEFAPRWASRSPPQGKLSDAGRL